MRTLAQLRHDPQAFPPALDDLAERSSLLASLVEACSRRRDVQELRARILLVLLAMRLPVGASRGKNWYVDGAVARLGAAGLRRAWRGFFGDEPPCLRTVRTHLGALEGAGAIVRRPGDWLPIDETTPPDCRSRWPDTLIVLDGDRETEWWASEGRARLERHPEARRDPTAWLRVFGDWRVRVRERQLELPFGRPAASPPRACEIAPRRRSAGFDLAARLRECRSVHDVLRALSRSGAGLEPRATWRAAARPQRLYGAAALLAGVLARGDRVRNPAAWLWRAFVRAPDFELDAARRKTGIFSGLSSTT